MLRISQFCFWSSNVIEIRIRLSDDCKWDGGSSHSLCFGHAQSKSIWSWLFASLRIDGRTIKRGLWSNSTTFGRHQSTKIHREFTTQFFFSLQLFSRIVHQNEGSFTIEVWCNTSLTNLFFDLGDQFHMRHYKWSRLNWNDSNRRVF